MLNVLLPSFVLLLPAAHAAARVVAPRAAPVASPVARIAPLSVIPAGAALTSPLTSRGMTLTPSPLAASLVAPQDAPSPVATVADVVAAPAAPATVARVYAPAAAAARFAASPSAAPEDAPAVGRERETASALSAAAAVSAAPARLDEYFDGVEARSGPVVTAAPSPAAGRRTGRLAAAVAGGVFLTQPAVALAAAVPAAVDPGALALIGFYAPLATVVAAVIGALYGLWSSRSPDGTPGNAGHVFASALSHGAIAGAAAFTLFDLTSMAFLGTTAAALTPLTAAVATAALAQAAFAAKFMLPATTPAERVMGAFPAVAMSFGLSLTASAFLAPSLMLTLGTAALMLTGAATALFTAIFRLDGSPAGGPAAMGRGFVLQVLMTGLALALGPSPYAYFFFALGLWGFATVMQAAAKEAWAALPKSFTDRFKKP